MLKHIKLKNFTQSRQARVLMDRKERFDALGKRTDAFHSSDSPIKIVAFRCRIEFQIELSTSSRHVVKSGSIVIK